VANNLSLSLQITSELDSLQAASQWRELIGRIDILRDELGPLPELLFRSGFASAQVEDFHRAHRLMADALLSEFNPDWLPWLAAVYDKLNWSLPMWVAAHWLVLNQPERNGVGSLYERARAKIIGELELRQLPPAAPSPSEINQAMAHRFNIKLVEHLQAGDGDKAIEVGEGARLFYPNYQPLLVNLSIAYKRMNKYENAGRVCLHALALDPLGSGVISNFGSMLIAAGSSHDAARLLECGAILFREETSIWSNLAVSYNNMKVAPWEAELAARRAIALDDKLAASWSALAGALCRQGRMEESLEASRMVGSLEPLRKNESLFNLNYSSSLSVEDISAAHFEAAEARLGRYYRDQIFDNDRNPNKRLRVGFVSGDLLGHPVAYFMEPIFEHLPKFYDVFVYHNRPAPEEDAVSETIKAYPLKWRNIAELSDDALHKLILEDQIDVLVDLSGHTAYHRLPVFAMRAAPIQVSYMGYPNTTGLKTMDYYLCHETVVTEKLSKLFSEELFVFKKTSAVYRPLVKNKALIRDEKYKVSETPALKNGFVTFGTLNNIAKISDDVISVWSEILKTVQGSKIFVESPGFHQRDFVRDFTKRFERFGVTKDRVILRNRDPNLQYIRYNEFDIALDPFPFGGGTTTCDALWMGMPLVTLYGNTLMSRSGLSALTILGRPEWACATADEYVRCAADLASDVKKLNELRLGLRGEMERSPLMDYDGFAGDLASAFRQMWARYVAENGGTQ
jgi:protein O-GlcNAc transferase